MNRKAFFLYLFFVVALIELIALATDFATVHQAVKPLIMLALIGYYLASVDVRSGAFVRAMFFSWAGDVLLIFVPRGEIFFIAGLLAFLISHLLFIQTYRVHRGAGSGAELMGTQKVRFSLPIVLLGTGLVVVLYPSLGSLRLPVLVYAMVLTIMVMSALFRFGLTNSQSFWMVFSGAVLFMASDSILALNKFLNPVPAAGLLTMFTYMSAQFLIAEGIIRHRGD